ncbi:hypothetical protein AMCSP05_002304 [Streptococcus pneumoniae 2070425]|uniref:Phage protein n=2 Tax=Malkevirus TaxID=3425749 RepID=E8ZDL8_9CAUD|nr:hypothetical protein SP670_0072 [Streptococcus pneumoniae 670-6B]EJG43821.1 hypothetical protein AMCSP05_002304 [Streptococcus pneumoniae 2070425]CBW39109.1 Phage protein [Streptococcus phage 23782]CBW39154.1 Phage protein [Streptococcus phage 11865]CEX97344.1 Uncharacterised protein [Streptococcus pneumoniae]
MISGKILGKIWENLGRIGAEKGAKIVLSNDWATYSHEDS